MNKHHTNSIQPNPTGLAALVGNTPLLCLRHTALAAGLPPTVELYAKAEWFNPSGSVKDRAALHIIRMAKQDGRLCPGMTLLDSTSGNMGISYAMLGISHGYKLKLVLPANTNAERIAILRAYGVDFILTDPAEGSKGAIETARRLARANPYWFYANQYDNPANWLASYHTMGQEIWQQTNGRVTHFAAVLGSGGTFIGTSRRLQEFNSNITCISVQAQTAHENIKGLKHMPSAIKPAIYDETVADDVVYVTRKEAFAMLHLLGKCDGILVGPSAAAAVAAACKIARQIQTGHIVTVLPDSSLKYLSEAPFTIPDQ